MKKILVGALYTFIYSCILQQKMGKIKKAIQTESLFFIDKI